MIPATEAMALAIRACINSFLNMAGYLVTGTEIATLIAAPPWSGSAVLIL
jgi:hypothetical protein